MIQRLAAVVQRSSGFVTLNERFILRFVTLSNEGRLKYCFSSEKTQVQALPPFIEYLLNETNKISSQG